MGILIRKPGVATTVQDTGRFGYMGSGFSPSGVMDRRALRLANLLVDNDPDDCVLEFALAGPTLRFTTDTFIALTGADFSARLDGAEAPLYRALPVHRGSKLSFGAPRRGVYGYIAFAGGSLSVAKVMGSRSTNLKCSLGGWHGRTLAPNDYIPFAQKETDYLPMQASHELPYDDIYPKPGEIVELRVIPGPQEELFTDAGIKTFYEQTFETTVKSDRMGYRLDGPAIETIAGSDIISDGIAFGAVQVPSHGRPIIMLADRQTTGGYAKIATVASVDIPKLVQSTPGTAISFKRISVGEAQCLYREQEKYYAHLEKVVTRPTAGGASPRRTARRLTPILERQALASRGKSLWIDTPSAHSATKENG